MTARVISGVVALACTPICGLSGMVVVLEMVDKVNDKLPKKEQFDPMGWYLSKRYRLNREYRRLYPDGRLLSKVRTLEALMIACFLLAAWGFGIFAK